MPNEYSISQSNFETLLGWLDVERDAAGEKYEKIRDRLIWIFSCRGCFDAEELADETVNRVISKLPGILPTYVGEPALYFYGIANNVHREWIRKQVRLRNLQASAPSQMRIPDDPDVHFDCLENCLAKLPPEKRNLVIRYYQESKAAKVVLRKELADELNITVSALQIRMHRIRETLRQCISKCVAADS